MPPEAEFVVDFPTLGFLAADWIEAHCPVPDGFRQGQPFVMYDWQLWCAVNHYRVNPDAVYGQLAPAFFYRRSQVVGPQKIGKGPWSAAMVAFEACGPAVFAGWAKKGDKYRCADHWCRCGWEFAYDAGDPMGRQWATPLIQLLATSEDQVANIYRPLQAMVRGGPLGTFIKAGEQFSRVGADGRIDVVTSSAQSRLGNPIVFAMQDETGLYTKENKLRNVAETMRRGTAGMGGRSIETTNPWDPAEQSVAQTTWESLRPDIFRYFDQPPANLSYRNKVERARIHRYVYRGATHVDLASIEAEAAELLETDPAQAERFFGNRLVASAGSWLEEPEKWDELAEDKPRLVAAKTRITIGFDGSMYDDWTAIRARVVTDQKSYGFTPEFADGKPMIWNPTEHGGEVPRGEVQAGIEYLFDHFDVVRGYFDPELWQSEIDAWVDRYGDQRIVSWPTYRTRQMAAALERLKTDIGNKAFTHDGDFTTALHMRNARKVRRPGGYVIGKPNDHQKIDAVMADALAHEALGDVIAAGLANKKTRQVVGF